MPSDLNEEEKKIFRNTLANKKILIYDDIYLYLLDELLIHPRLFVYFEKLNFNAISQNQKYEIKED